MWSPSNTPILAFTDPLLQVSKIYALKPVVQPSKLALVVNFFTNTPVAFKGIVKLSLKIDIV